MPVAEPDVDAVSRLIAQVSAEIVLPRFRMLGAADVAAKTTTGDIEDIVTVVDHEAEAALTDGLRQVLDAPVIGEEAAAHDASVLSRLDSEGPMWIVDPLDGTKNFAAGDDGFGVMVSFVRKRRTRAAWIDLAARGERFVAQAGSGTYQDGARVYVSDILTEPPLRGTLFVRFMPPDLRQAVVAAMEGRFAPAPACGAAAIEYTDVLRGRKDFAIYYRLLPWDHGAPALVLTEAGGSVSHLDGSAYVVSSSSQVTLVARDSHTAERLRGWIGGRA